MKIFLKATFFSLLCLASFCVGAQTNTRVIGKLKNLQKGTVVYLAPVSSRLKKDSVVSKKGKFEFNMALEEGDYYRLIIGKSPVRGGVKFFYLQPGVLKIKGKESLLLNAEMSGSQFAEEQNDLKKYISREQKKYEPHVTNYTEAWEKNDSASMAALRPKYMEWSSARKELYRKWFMAHPSSPVSAMVLMYQIEERNMEKLQELLDHLQPEAKQNALAKQMQQRIEISKTTAVGKPAPDFVQNDTSGKPVALKDFRGKYVLLDFWASWCVPCRHENPNLVKVYNHFKDKNFTILGVSLDQPGAKNKWLKAIQDDQLTWTHVSDLQYWDNEVARLYGIKSLPSNLLIGPDGVILAKNLRGERLEERLKKFINKPIEEIEKSIK